jgi:hypothetical protein
LKTPKGYIKYIKYNGQKKEEKQSSTNHYTEKQDKVVTFAEEHGEV